MKLNTYYAQKLTTTTELPVIEDLQEIYSSAIRAVDDLSEALKTNDNLGKIFFLKSDSGNYRRGKLYVLVKEDGVFKFKIAEVKDNGSFTLTKFIEQLEDYETYQYELPTPGTAIYSYYRPLPICL